MHVASFCIRNFEKSFISRGEILLLVEVGEIFRLHFVIYYGFCKLPTELYRFSFDNHTVYRLIIGKILHTSTESRISPRRMDDFSKFRMQNEATFACYPKPARKHCSGERNMDFSRGKHFFLTLVESSTDIQNPTHVHCEPHDWVDCDHGYWHGSGVVLRSCVASCVASLTNFIPYNILWPSCVGGFGVDF